MNYQMIEVYNKEVIRGKEKYNFIIEEKWTLGSRKRRKFYRIKRNGEYILHTTLHQTWYAHRRRIEGGK